MILPVLTFPDKRLRIKAKQVAKINNKTKQLITNMFETMYAKGGIGLAATQVNQHQRIIVLDVPNSKQYEALKQQRNNDNALPIMVKNNPLCLINPNINSKSGETESEEGCLSVPNFNVKVKRAKNISIRALNEQNKIINLNANGLLAICIQHELDHLNGKLFVDYLSQIKRDRLKKKLTKAA